MELKDLKFTKDEFDMLIRGLEELPNGDQAGELMGGLIETLLLEKMPDDLKRKRDIDQAREKKAKEIKKALLKENCCILQSKLIQLRRYMESNDMIIEAQDIIDGKK